MARRTFALGSFWAKVDTSGDCWNWLGALRGGYGHFRIGDTTVATHRFAYMLHNDDDIDDERIAICHTCDNRSCVKPAHLYKGSWKTNFDDMKERGRLSAKFGADSGESNHQVVLNWPTVRLIRACEREGMGSHQISRLLRLNRSTVQNVLKDRSWPLSKQPTGNMLDIT